MAHWHEGSTYYRIEFDDETISKAGWKGLESTVKPSGRSYPHIEEFFYK